MSFASAVLAPIFEAGGANFALRNRERIQHGAISFLAALGIACLLALAFSAWRAALPPPPPLAAAPPSTWVEIVKPSHMFSVETPLFGKSPRLYEARSHREGGGRQDTLAYGAAAPGDAPLLHMMLYRRGSEALPEATFFVEIARRAAQAGFSVSRSGLPEMLPSRFGAFEVADMQLGYGAGVANCMGFRLQVGNPALLVSGFACGGSAGLDRPGLACALDRLDLASAGGDGELAKFFSLAESARGKACAGVKSAAPRKAGNELPTAGIPPNAVASPVTNSKAPRQRAAAR